MIVTKKSMNPFPLMVFEAEAFADIPVAPPKLNVAETPRAFADVTGLLSAKRRIKVMFATYVPFPLRKVNPVIARLAWALTEMNRLIMEYPLITRPEYCPLPLHNALILMEGWLIALPAIVMRKSMYAELFGAPTVTGIMFDALVDSPEAPLKFKAAVIPKPLTPPVFVKSKRTTNVVPAMWVALTPAWRFIDARTTFEGV